MKGRVSDVAALIDLATGRTHYTRALVTVALQQITPLAVPASALAVAWAQVPAKARLTLATLCEQSVALTFPLDALTAAAIGELGDHDTPTRPGPGGGPGTATLDLAAAHVAVISADRGWPAVTDRGPHLRALIPGLQVESLP